MPKLSFHQRTLDALGLSANQSNTHTSGLKALEEQSGTKLPTAIFEWYSLEQAFEALGSGSGNEHRYPSPVEGAFWKMELEHAYPRISAEGNPWWLYRPEEMRGKKKQEAYSKEFDLEQIPKTCLCLVIASGGAVSLFSIFDGTEDPPVYNNGDTENIDEWLQVSKSFSEFVYDWIRECNK